MPIITPIMTEAMESMSIAQGCDRVASAIAKASTALDDFIREVRESRSDLDGMIGELQALDRILNRLRDDADAFPVTLANHTPVVLEQCVIILTELDGYITVLNSDGVSKIDKKFRWIATQKTIVKLGVALQGYRSALGLAWDLVSIRSAPKLGCTNNPRGAGGVDREGSEGHQETGASSSSRTKDQVSLIMGEMRHLIYKVQQQSAAGNGAVLGLENYLKDLQDQAFAAAGADWDVALINACHGSCPSDDGDDPDSAIELSDGPSLPASPIKETPPPAPAPTLSLTLEEIDEMLDELRDMVPVPSRAPTPPPRSRARIASYRSDPPSLCDRRRSYSDSEYSRHSIVEDALPEPDIPRRMSFDSGLDEQSVAVTEITQTEETVGRNNESLYSFMTRDSTNSSSRPSTTRKSSRLGRALSFIRRQSIVEPPVEKPDDEPRTAPPGLVRRHTHRLSVVMHSKVPMFRTQPVLVEEEPNAVFGVSLAKSIAVARGTAKMNHSGSGSSKRDFPRCVFKCIAFIKEEDGIATENIFAEGGDPERVQLLRDIFSKAPKYGEDVDWRFFGVHEAAALIMLFLAQLKKPLVPEAVVRRWVSLSRQAAMPGSHAQRLDQCIDFWEEALSGIRGPARNLFKLLLNLWGDVADAAGENDMTAERLAGAVIRPLMHSTPGKHDTDYLLGLAFLIRKRTEYTALLKGEGKSNAAFQGAD